MESDAHLARANKASHRFVLNHGDFVRAAMILIRLAKRFSPFATTTGARSMPFSSKGHGIVGGIGYDHAGRRNIGGSSALQVTPLLFSLG